MTNEKSHVVVQSDANIKPSLLFSFIQKTKMKNQQQQIWSTNKRKIFSAKWNENWEKFRINFFFGLGTQIIETANEKFIWNWLRNKTRKKDVFFPGMEISEMGQKISSGEIFRKKKFSANFFIYHLKWNLTNFLMNFFSVLFRFFKSRFLQPTDMNEAFLVEANKKNRWNHHQLNRKDWRCYIIGISLCSSSELRMNNMNNRLDFYKF